MNFKIILFIVFAIIILGLFLAWQLSWLGEDETDKDEKTPIGAIRHEVVCRAQEGVWMQETISPFAEDYVTPRNYCNFKTGDGGKECSDSTHCEGECIITRPEATRIFSGKDWGELSERGFLTDQKGKCSEWEIPTEWCPFYVNEGIVEMVVCD